MKLYWCSLICLTGILVYSIVLLHFNEDIREFMPLEDSDKESFGVYENLSGANRLFVLFSNPGDEDMTVEAIEHFLGEVQELDTSGWCREITAQVDENIISEATDFVYGHIPYFLTDSDYRRMDSLLALPHYVTEQLARDRELLMLPTGAMLTQHVARDPLNLFTPVMESLRRSNPQSSFELYDGYIFTGDLSCGIVMVTSPFGNSETEHNSQLLGLLNDALSRTHEKYPNVEAHVTGGPVIAVGNASQIKTDSIKAIVLASVLIVLLLVFSLQSVRNILLILLSIGWGWLFALGVVALFRSDVSIIVLGISSVILGIAINYPLHLISHTNHQPDIRRAIKEIWKPLVVGNITTVGAFLALVPLNSSALRDLGIFASLMLVGTILFVLLYLPRMVKVGHHTGFAVKLLDNVAGYHPEQNRIIVWGTLVVTAILAFFSVKVEFDSNIANINYMTEQQRADMTYFQQFQMNASSDDQTTVYVYSSGETTDEALQGNLDVQATVDSLMDNGFVAQHRGVSRFLIPEKEQHRRLDRWKEFVKRNYNILTEEIQEAASANGFSSAAFQPYFASIQEAGTLECLPADAFVPLYEMLFSQNITENKETGTHYVVEPLSVPDESLDQVKQSLPHCFDVASINNRMANALSDNFNYIGWACSLIVFFFLWFSFGKIELAIISFLPMALSWVCILGLMALLGIKFNIVNIILATFIFGQGDDYTIFMTEGCQYEYTHHRPILPSYKVSILQSALIMFIGIGSLIIAKHPAMHSLAEVTIIGMISVVFMAYLIPPLLFRWLTMKNGEPRRHPITLASIFLRRKSNPDYYKTK